MCDPILKSESNYRFIKQNKNTPNSSPQIRIVKRDTHVQMHMYMYKHTYKLVHVATPCPSAELDQGSERWESRHLGKCQPRIKKCFLCKPRIPNEI